MYGDDFMEQIDKKIKQMVHRVRRRWIISRLIKYCLYGLCGGLMTGIVLVLMRLFIPITFIYTKLGILLAISLGIGFIYSLLRLPSELETAKAIDGFGLKERTITAIEIMSSQHPHPYGDLIKKDAYGHLRKIEPKTMMPILPPVKSLARVLALLGILIITWMIPSQHESWVAEKEKVQIAKREIQKDVQKIKKEIKEDTYLTEEVKKDLEKVISELNKDILHADNEKELEKRAEANLELMKFKKDQAKEKRFKDITEKLLANQKSEALGKALENKDFDLAKREINKLMEDMSNMSDEDYDALLSSLSEQLEGIDMEQLSDALNQLASDMELTNNQLGNSQYALSNGNNASDGQPGASNGNRSSEGNSGSSNSGQNNGGNNGSGNGSGSGSGSDSGNGNGSGNGSGSNGSGNGNQQGGNGNGSGIGSGRGSGSANQGTDGQRVDGTTSDEQVNGQRDDKDSDLQLVREGVSIAGEKIPYDRIIGEYESKAYETMNSSDIPKGMQEVVKEYFSGLN